MKKIVIWVKDLMSITGVLKRNKRIKTPNLEDMFISMTGQSLCEN